MLEPRNFAHFWQLIESRRKNLCVICLGRFTVFSTGADIIISYYTPDILKWLKEDKSR